MATDESSLEKPKDKKSLLVDAVRVPVSDSRRMASTKGDTSSCAPDAIGWEVTGVEAVGTGMVVGWPAANAWLCRKVRS